MRAKKEYQIHFRVDADELKRFKDKAKNYNSISDMVRDAVRLFDDRMAISQLEELNKLSTMIHEQARIVSNIAGNFNQLTKRANELAIAGELNSSYFSEVIAPENKKIQGIILSYKRAMDKAFRKIRNKE